MTAGEHGLFRPGKYCSRFALLWSRTFHQALRDKEITAIAYRYDPAADGNHPILGADEWKWWTPSSVVVGNC